MRKRLLLSMSIAALILVILITGLYMWILYRQAENDLKEQMRDSLFYIKTILNENEMSIYRLNENKSMRISLISRDGNVIYDSWKSNEKMENHGSRPEVIEAFEKGYGEDVRKSKTLSEITYYMAERLDSGNVIRLSFTKDTISTATRKNIPLILLAVLSVFILSYFLSRMQLKRIIEPINKIDLEKPVDVDNEIYPELVPFLERIESQRLEIQSRACEMENYRKEFAANVSHELKTPLTAISGFAELMETGLVKEEDVQEMAGRIHDEAGRLLVLINDIMKLSQLEEGKNTLTWERVDLHELSESVIKRLSERADKAGVTLRIAGERLNIMVVPGLMEEFIYNLCDNSIKYNKRGGEVVISILEKENSAVIEVADTGIGIPKDHIDRIFERFYRVDKSHSKTTGGTGLGLSIVKHIAVLHRGKLAIESSLGKGTKISLTLPYKK